jgi:integrase
MIISDLTAKRLKLPPGKIDHIEWDDKLPRFGVRIRQSGAKTYVVQYRNERGEQRRETLGPVDLIPAARARKHAERDLASVKLGEDPQGERNEARRQAEDSFESVAARYIDRRKNPERDERALKPRTLQQVETHLTKHWARLNKIPVRQITFDHIKEAISKIRADRGAFAARRAKASLSKFFSWALNEGLVGASPLTGLKLGKEPARTRVLDDRELAQIWRACPDNDYGRIVKLLMLTGQRRDEVGLMATGEIDLEKRQWSIPETRTKNGLPHQVPLSDAAIAIIKAAREGGEHRQTIFGRDDSGFSGWSKAKQKIDRRLEQNGAELGDWRLHDLRRTCATRMADIGVLPHVIEAVLNHISGHKAGVAGIYNRALYAAERRQALDMWSEHVLALVAGKARSNVVTIRGRS